MSDGAPGYWEKLQEIEEVAHKVLNDWERDFIESMIQHLDADYAPTEKQLAVLDKIYQKVCDSPY